MTNLLFNDVIRLPDGRVGTICYSNLDGFGGVWGWHVFEKPTNSFSDSLPPPQFMLRDKSVEAQLKKHWRGPEYAHIPEMECVGDVFEREARP